MVRSRFVVYLGLALAWAPPADAANGTEPPPPRVRAWQTGLLRADRVRHASASLTAGMTIGVLSREPASALGGALVIGVIKELWDARHGSFDALDLCADAAGAALAAGATAALRR